jgi:hypothetical protein
MKIYRSSYIFDRLLVLAQNVPYLVSKGVPEQNAQPIIDYIKTFEKKDQGKVLKYVIDNPTLSLDQIKEFKVIGKEEKEKVKEEKYPPELREWINKFDEKYHDWIVKMVKNRSIVATGEDDEKIKETLKTFDELKAKKKEDEDEDEAKKLWRKEHPEWKKIEQYKTFTEFYDIIWYLSGKEEEQVTVNTNDPNIVLNKNGIVIYKYLNNPQDMQKCNEMSKDSGWCTGYSDMYNLKNYMSQGPLYMVFVDGNREILIHQASGQIKQLQNAPVYDYKLVKRVNPYLEELGIAPPPAVVGTGRYNYTDPQYDYGKYNGVMKNGEQVEKEISDSTDKYLSLKNLQLRKEREDPSVFGKFGGSSTGNNNVINYLNDSQFQDPSVQQYTTEIWDDFLSKTENNVLEFAGGYKKLPFGARLIPNIREKNKNRFTKAIEMGSINDSTYRDAGRELKSYPEIQNALKTVWKKALEKDPKLFTSDKFPEKFKRSMQKDYLEAVETNLKTNFEDYIVNTPNGIINTVFEGLPKNLQQIDSIKNAQRNGFLAYITKKPKALTGLQEPLKSDPEFIKAAKIGLLEIIKKDPSEYSKLPAELQQDPEFVAAAREGLLYKVERDPSYLNQLTPNFKNDPEFIEAARKGWINEMDALSPRSFYDKYFDDQLSIPPTIKNDPEFLQIKIRNFETYIITKMKNNPAVFLETYRLQPQEVRSIPSIQEACEKLAIDIIKEQRPKLLDALPEEITSRRKFKTIIEQIYKPMWLAKVKADYKYYSNLPNSIAQLPSFIEASKEGWINAFRNPKDLGELELLKNYAPLHILKLQEVKDILAGKQTITNTTSNPHVDMWVNTVTNNPFTLKSVPTKIKNDPEFQQKFKPIFIKYLQTSKPNPKAIELFISQNKSPMFDDPEIQQALRTLGVRTAYNQTPLTKVSSWYQLSQQTQLNPIDYELEQIKNELNYLDLLEN